MDFSAENPNFYFKEFLAYTEDQCLIHNLFVYNIPKTFTKDDLARYFSRYGLIEKIRPFVDKKRSRRNAPNVAFINFVEASSAAIALQTNEHKIQNKRVYIKACDSWHQPKPNEDYLTGKPNEGMLKLNDDCLEAICRKLELCDQVRFARVCYRFREVFRLCCKIKFKSLRVDEFNALSLWEARDFLEIVGPYVENLSGILPYKDRDRIIDFVGRYCCNLKIVYFEGCNLKHYVLRKMVGNLNFVTDLSLRECSMSDNTLLMVKKLPSLKNLCLSENYELTGKNIDKLQNLEKLDLYGCSNIQPAYLINAFPNFDELRELDIRQCHRITTTFYTQMAEHFPKLEVLKIPCTDVVYDSVTSLPSLKHLELLCLTPTGGSLRLELFEKLALRKADQLETLVIVAHNIITLPIIRYITRLTKLKKLSCANNRLITDDCLRKFAELRDLEELNIRNCNSITNDGLLCLLENCENLKHINAMQCTRITEKFVYDAMTHLNNRLRPPTEPVFLYVGGSGIEVNALESSEQFNEREGRCLKVIFSRPPNTDPNGHLQNDIIPFVPELIEGFDPSDEDDYFSDDFDDQLMDDDDSVMDDHLDEFYADFDDLYMYAQNGVFGDDGW